jgi:hypothetical protein
VARDRELMKRLAIEPLVPAGLAATHSHEHAHEEGHVHGPDCSHSHAPARPGAACNATRQR